jgi:hypothetical protein
MTANGKKLIIKFVMKIFPFFAYLSRSIPSCLTSVPLFSFCHQCLWCILWADLQILFWRSLRIAWRIRYSSPFPQSCEDAHTFLIPCLINEHRLDHSNRMILSHTSLKEEIETFTFKWLLVTYVKIWNPLLEHIGHFLKTNPMFQVVPRSPRLCRGRVKQRLWTHLTQTPAAKLIWDRGQASLLCFTGTDYI